MQQQLNNNNNSSQQSSLIAAIIPSMKQEIVVSKTCGCAPRRRHSIIYQDFNSHGDSISGKW
jgi:hypothetical protein